MKTQKLIWTMGLGCVLASVGAVACSAPETTAPREGEAVGANTGDVAAAVMTLADDEVDDELPEGVAAITSWGFADDALIGYRTDEAGQAVPYASVSKDGDEGFAVTFYNAQLGEANIIAATNYVLRLVQEGASESVEGADAGPAAEPSATMTPKEARKYRRNLRWRKFKCNLGNVGKWFYYELGGAAFGLVEIVGGGIPLVVVGSVGAAATWLVPCAIPGMIIEGARAKADKKHGRPGERKWTWSYTGPMSGDADGLRTVTRDRGGAEVPLCAPNFAFSHVGGAGLWLFKNGGQRFNYDGAAYGKCADMR